ncbi:unnamed protein product [Meloidogyne enterolobii]|uniref:Uncharacterized protein n=1 Tax=Meloidogyne enterolobii TaxID=390850 RepID=A0ACB1A6X7_MELEN
MDKTRDCRRFPIHTWTTIRIGFSSCMGKSNSCICQRKAFCKFWTIRLAWSKSIGD